ncbi:MAG: Ldh family oxidoreductase, partial [bacterium]|nr:Ldh family oxidoreductase [bacterium]
MADRHVRIDSGALLSFTQKVIASTGVSEDRARTTADILVGADLRGISSHGVAGGTGLSELIERIREGAIFPDALPEIEHNNDWALATVNARGGLGPPAAL